MRDAEIVLGVHRGHQQALVVQDGGGGLDVGDKGAKAGAADQGGLGLVKGIARCAGMDADAGLDGFDHHVGVVADDAPDQKLRGGTAIPAGVGVGLVAVLDRVPADGKAALFPGGHDLGLADDEQGAAIELAEARGQGLGPGARRLDQLVDGVLVLGAQVAEYPRLCPGQLGHGRQQVIHVVPVVVGKQLARMGHDQKAAAFDGVGVGGGDGLQGGRDKDLVLVVVAVLDCSGALVLHLDRMSEGGGRRIGMVQHRHGLEGVGARGASTQAIGVGDATIGRLVPRAVARLVGDGAGLRDGLEALHIVLDADLAGGRGAGVLDGQVDGKGQAAAGRRVAGDNEVRLGGRRRVVDADVDRVLAGVALQVVGLDLDGVTVVAHLCAVPGELGRGRLGVRRVGLEADLGAIDLEHHVAQGAVVAHVGGDGDRAADGGALGGRGDGDLGCGRVEVG